MDPHMGGYSGTAPAGTGSEWSLTWGISGAAPAGTDSEWSLIWGIIAGQHLPVRVVNEASYARGSTCHYGW